MNIMNNERRFTSAAGVTVRQDSQGESVLYGMATCSCSESPTAHSTHSPCESWRTVTPAAEENVFRCSCSSPFNLLLILLRLLLYVVVAQLGLTVLTTGFQLAEQASGPRLS